VAKILVIDDEAAMRFLIRMAFEVEGHEVDEAAHGQAALDIIESGWVPDLIATDYMMPVMDGAELIARIRSDPRTREVPVVMISASAGAEQRSEPDLFLRKPFDPVALAGHAERLLSRG
jgi:CheY-like chemotaxis protein